MGMSLASLAGQFVGHRCAQPGLPGVMGPALARNTNSPHKAASPLRHGTTAALTRVLVADGRQPGQAGRMVISGRIDAVCAELERLARLETH